MTWSGVSISRQLKFRLPFDEQLPHRVVEDLVALLGGDAPLFQHQDAVQPQPQSAGGGEHGVIALSLPGGHHQVVALVFRIPEQVFELADLVSAQGDAAQVVPLDPNIGPQLPAHVGQTVHGGREQPQRFFFKMVHGVLLFSKMSIR